MDWAPLKKKDNIFKNPKGFSAKERIKKLFINNENCISRSKVNEQGMNGVLTLITIYD